MIIEWYVFFVEKYFLLLLWWVSRISDHTENEMSPTDIVNRIDLTSVNGPISPNQCYYEVDYSFY